VPLGVAFGIGAARIVKETRVDALAVAAGLAILAFGVGLAADRFTFDLGVADSSFRTLTDWTVVGEEALGPSAAVAGVHADPVDAGGVLLTLVVADATWE